MVAVYIDPAVCHTIWGYLIPECYGIAVMSGCVLGALVIAYGYRKAINIRPPETDRTDRVDMLRDLGVQ